MMTHTPGPWSANWTNEVGPDDDYYVEFWEILDADGNEIGQAKTAQDAALMCAAPELLAALIACLPELEFEKRHLCAANGEEMPHFFNARQAIKKAIENKATNKQPVTVSELIDVLQYCITESGAFCFSQDANIKHVIRRLESINNLCRAAIAKATGGTE